MPALSPAEQVERIRRGAVEIITEPELLEKFKHRPQLVIKAGFDPTAPDLHLGHTVLLRKLRQFQDLGHKVVFLIGDATALVGDPSGQSKTRKMMTPAEVERNAHTYEQQVARVLDMRDDRFLRLHNGDWFTRAFGLKELMELTSRYTVARVLERDDFQKRLKGGQEISLSELLYPIMQGYDSVQIAKHEKSQACDVEVGGTDQKFNLLVGRDLQRAYGQEPQVVLTMPLLEGTDGVQKMSKSLGNHIGIQEPPKEMFGKLMSIPDGLILKYFTLLTDVPDARLEKLTQELKTRARNPRDIKAELAETLVEQYHPGQGRSAREEFVQVFSKRQTPSDVATVALAAQADGTVDLVELIVAQGIAKTKNEARRLLKQGGVKLNGAVVKRAVVPAREASGLLQVGARHFRQLAVPGASPR